MKSVYLVAYYFQKPSHQRVQTQKAGWMKDSNNVSWDEQVAITRNLKNKDITIAKVIIDLANLKVVRNSWNSATTFDELLVYFSKNYHDQVKNIMMQLNPDYYNRIFPPAQPTINSATESFDSSAVAEVRVVDTPST